MKGKNSLSKTKILGGINMKKIMRKSICLVVVTALILLTFNLSVSSAASSEKRALTEPILTNIERVKIDADEPLETTLGKYTKDISEVSNEKAEAMLKKFDIPFEDIKTAEVVHDNSLDRTVTRLKSDKVQIDFDDKGNVVNLINYEDFSTVDKNRRDYATNQSKSKPDPVIKYKTKEDLSEILSNLVSENNLIDYELVNCDFDGYETWTLVWNKNIGKELVNPYDVLVVMVDAKDGSITNLIRNTINENFSDPKVTKEKATNIANELIAKKGLSKIKKIELSVYNPNFYWEENGPYQNANIARLSWKVTLEDAALIYIDAETGENLGGGESLSAARAVSTLPNTDSSNHANVTAAASALTRLGYEQPNALNTARAETIAAGGTDCSLAFHGDSNYWGWDWN